MQRYRRASSDEGVEVDMSQGRDGTIEQSRLGLEGSEGR